MIKEQTEEMELTDEKDENYSLLHELNEELKKMNEDLKKRISYYSKIA
jgi:hypothetical protein